MSVLIIVGSFRDSTRLYNIPKLSSTPGLTDEEAAQLVTVISKPQETPEKSTTCTNSTSTVITGQEAQQPMKPHIIPYTDYDDKKSPSSTTHSANIPTTKVIITTPCEEIKTAGDRIKVEHGDPYLRSKSPVSDFYKDALTAARSRSVSSCSSRGSDLDLNLKDLQGFDEMRESLNPSRNHSRNGSAKGSRRGSGHVLKY